MFSITFTIVLLSLICNFTSAKIIIELEENISSSLRHKRSAGLNGTEIVPLYKFINVEYYGIIGLGHPSKEFKFSFDTTWSDVLVASKRCAMFEIPCQMHNKYDNTKSSTYKPIGQVINLHPVNNSDAYSIIGFTSIDNFHLGHMELLNQTFIEATHLSYKPFMYKIVDGIIGLGFSKNAVTKSRPFFYNLRKNLNESVFTLYMNRDATTARAGRLILGTTDRSHAKGPLIDVPLLGSKDYWKIKIDRVVVNVYNKSYPFGINAEAYIDSANQAILGPPDEIAQINAYINAVNIGFGNYMVNCREYAKLPNVTFTINDFPFTITSKYYVKKVTFNGLEMCLSPFNAINNNGAWFLGGAFLMEFYTEYYYDDSKIVIAQTLL